MTAGAPRRRRGSIELDAAKCTSCMICVRECPVWCIELVADKTHDPNAGPRGRSTLELTDFRIDLAQFLKSHPGKLDTQPLGARQFWSGQYRPCVQSRPRHYSRS